MGIGPGGYIFSGHTPKISTCAVRSGSFDFRCQVSGVRILYQPELTEQLEVILWVTENTMDGKNLNTTPGELGDKNND